MALITCPECQQQISDQATVCPNCGFPLSNESSNAPANQQINDDSAAKAPRKKKTIVAISIVICVLFMGIAGYFVKKNADEKAQAEALAAARTEYIANLNDMLLISLAGAAESENMCNLTYKVWYDTIYEEYRYETADFTQQNGRFRDDFNDALIALYSDEKTAQSVNDIKANRTLVDEIFKNLNNPTEEFQSCYDVVDELYSAYHNLTELALNPSGNLKSYSENFEQYDSAYMEQYNKLNLLIPEE